MAYSIMIAHMSTHWLLMHFQSRVGGFIDTKFSLKLVSNTIGVNPDCINTSCLDVHLSDRVILISIQITELRPFLLDSYFD